MAQSNTTYCGGCIDENLYRIIPDAALFESAERGCVECLAAAITAGANVIKYGDIAMKLAQNRRHFGCMAVLFNTGVAVNFRNDEEKTAVLSAVKALDQDKGYWN